LDGGREAVQVEKYQSEKELGDDGEALVEGDKRGL
jgi:hypothetical protein